MIIVGLDLGKKIGIAKAYEELRIAFPHKTVFSFNDLVKEIEAIKPKTIVVGWPLLLSGEEGLQCQRVKSMVANLLHQTYSMDIVYQDERFSTQVVQGSADEDASSAAWILQNYLNKV